MTEFMGLKEYLTKLAREDRERKQAHINAQHAQAGNRATDESLQTPLTLKDFGVPEWLNAELSGISNELGRHHTDILALFDKVSAVGDASAGTLDDVNRRITAMTKLFQSVTEKVAALDYRLGGFIKMHQTLRHDADKLRDRLYEHEQATRKTVDGLSAAVDQHSEKLATIYGKDLGRITALEKWLRTESDRVSDVAGSVRELGRVLEDPAIAFKIQYRFGSGPWKDYEPDLYNFLSLPSDGNAGMIAMRMVRK